MYQALYRKWRPRTFDDLVGQEHITETLKRQVQTDRLFHAYLFVGTRGTGKTTCAKILSRAINCTQPVNGNPCNECPSCTGIESGRILDVVEMDAASNNGVDHVRALRDEAIFTPASVKKRVYIIDEVHMLSGAAFNALLKILEEPPEHLAFILATTEIHKVPATILSRCQRFSFKRIMTHDISALLLDTAKRENINLTSDAADKLARLAGGSVRDALSLLDQCASENDINTDHVLSILGLAGMEETANLLTAVLENDGVRALSILDALYLDGKDMASVLDDLMILERDMLITAISPGADELLSGSFDVPSLKKIAAKATPQRLISGLELMKNAARDMSRSQNTKLSVELCIMQMCDERLSDDIPALRSRVATLEENIASLQEGAPITSAQYVSAQKAGPSVNAEAPATAPELPKPLDAPSLPQDLPEGYVPSPAMGTSGTDSPAPYTPELSSLAEDEEISDAPDTDTEPAALQEAADKAVSVPDDKPAADFWKNILSLTEPEIDIPPFTFLNDSNHCTAAVGSDALIITTRNDFAAQMINVPNVIAALQKSSERILGRSVAVKITAGTLDTVPDMDKLDTLSRFGNIKFE